LKPFKPDVNILATPKSESANQLETPEMFLSCLLTPTPPPVTHSTPPQTQNPHQTPNTTLTPPHLFSSTSNPFNYLLKLLTLTQRWFASTQNVVGKVTRTDPLACKLRIRLTKYVAVPSWDIKAPHRQQRGLRFYKYKYVEMSRQEGIHFVSSIFIHQLLFGLSLASYQYYNDQEKIQPSCYSKLACLPVKVFTIVRTCSGAPEERNEATRSMQASKRLTQKEGKLHHQ
jgi:hypothetical protein